MTDIELDEHIRKTLRDAAIVLSASLIVLFVSLVADIQAAGTNNPYFWLQRSGAIAVVLSAVVEFWFSKVRHDINPPASSYAVDPQWREKYGKKFDILSMAAIFILIGSTVIWGYGDLPFKNS